MEGKEKHPTAINIVIFFVPGLLHLHGTPNNHFSFGDPAHHWIFGCRAGTTSRYSSAIQSSNCIMNDPHLFSLSTHPSTLSSFFHSKILIVQNTFEQLKSPTEYHVCDTCVAPKNFSCRPQGLTGGAISKDDVVLLREEGSVWPPVIFVSN